MNAGGRTVIGIDCGAQPAIAVMRRGEVCWAKRYPKWDAEEMAAQVKLLSKKWKPALVAFERAFVHGDPKKARAALSQASKAEAVRLAALAAGVEAFVVAPQGDRRARQVLRVLAPSLEELGLYAEVSAPRGKHMRDALAIAEAALGELKARQLRGAA